jgi:protein O-mannosyl-transferase
VNQSPRYLMPLLVGSTFLVYLNGIKGGFLFDDYGVIVNYAPVHSFSAWVAALSHGIRPLLKLTYLLNWISGAGPLGFHLFNIWVHATNVVLVYMLAARLTECLPDRPSPAGLNGPAVLTAMFFALHPVQTEAVTYISGRSSSLMALFYLGSLLAYIRGSVDGKKKWLYIVSPLLFLLAVGTKETALTLPFALLLLERVIKSDSWPDAFKRQAIHWCMFFALIFLILVNERYGKLLWVSMETRSLHDNLLSQLNGITYLLSRLLWVQGLNIDPDLPVISKWSPALALQGIALVGIALLTILTRKKKPWIMFGAVWFFLILFPSNSVMPRLDIANERHLYLANFGMFFLISVELSSFGIFERKWATSCILALLALCAGFTVARNNVYRSNIALWEDTARKSPHKSRVFNNLGLSYELDGQTGKAVLMFDRALRLNPDNAIARRNLTRIRTAGGGNPAHNPQARN